jgi:hypothetical protein
MSCLFNSLNYFIKEGSNEIRQKICDYLKENKPIMSDMETKDVLLLESKSVEQYIQRMRQQSTWGGAIEIQCACNIWNLKIVVKNIRDRTPNAKCIEFLPVSNSYDNMISISWNGGHYEPIR